jgi:NADH-quinone oxidoreductase subunit H
MFAGSMSMLDIIHAQSHMWFFFMAPLAAVLFFVSAQAETGRAPFDLIEAESELVAGFNIEYSGMKFGMFFAGEFLHVFTNGVILAVLFFGGWLGPLYTAPLIAMFWLGLKAFVVYFISLWLRNTVPRLRIDQVMNFNWFFLVPLSIVNVLLTALILKVMQEAGIAPVNFAESSLGALLPLTIVLFLKDAILSLAIFQRLGAEEKKKNQPGTQSDELPAVAGAGD